MRLDPDLKTEEERRISQESASLFGQFLDDLKTKNLLRRTTDEEKERLLSILRSTWEFQGAFNEMAKQFDIRRFHNFIAKTGLTEETLVYSFVNQLLGNLLICYESLIKLSLLFFVDDKSGITKSMTLGKLLSKLKNISPSFFEKLNPRINRDLRNALAHGSFWLEKDGLHYVKNGYLEEERTIPLSELRDETRKASIIGRAFIHVISRKVKQRSL